jgi:hypothetical protein
MTVSCCPPLCFLDLHFDPEDGGDMFLRNISGLSRTTRRCNPEDREHFTTTAVRTSNRTRICTQYYTTWKIGFTRNLGSDWRKMRTHFTGNSFSKLKLFRAHSKTTLHSKRNILKCRSQRIHRTDDIELITEIFTNCMHSKQCKLQKKARITLFKIH